jgi:hypothetical protein
MMDETNIPDLPRYSMDVQSMDLGEGIKAVGLELIETESREPLRGPEAAKIWSATLPALAAREFWVLDFFSHLDRVQEFCDTHKIASRTAASRCLVVPQPSAEHLRELIARFAAETFGVRAGPAAEKEDVPLEQALSSRGLDAYQGAFTRYTFCGICEPDDGWVTLLCERLWPSEIIRRARPAVQSFDVYLARPQ